MNISRPQAILPFYEPFDYSVGDSLSMHGWVGFSSGKPILVTAGNLNYSGLIAPVGNKVSFDGEGKDYSKQFNTQTFGTIYMSYILQVTNLASLNYTGGYYTGFISLTERGATNWIKNTSTGFNLGINAKSTIASTVWSPTVYLVNTPIFIVFSYEIVLGAKNDIVRMWINPAPGTFGTTTPPTSTLSITNDLDDLIEVLKTFLLQSSTVLTPFIDMDEIRIGNTWASVTPTSTMVKEITDIDKFQISPNPSNGEFNVLFKPKTTYDIKVFNALGSIVYSQTNINSNYKIDLGSIDKGTYIIELKDNNSSAKVSKSIVIQ